MKPEAILIMIGGFLMLIGIIGGGFTIKEVTLPKIPTSSRILATIFGLIILGTGMYLSVSSMPNNNKPRDFVQEIYELEKKINNITKTNLEISEQKQEEEVKEAIKQLSQKPGQIEEQIDIFNKLEILQKKNLDETTKKIQVQLMDELEKSKKDLEHKFLEQKEIIEEEKNRIKNDFNQKLEKRIAEINKEWKDRLEIAQTEFKNQQKQKVQEQAPAEEAEQKRIAEENAKKEKKQEQAPAEEAEQKRIAEENAKRKAEAKNLIREYWIAVGQRNIETAIGKWDNPSVQKQDSLRSIISAKKYLKIKDIKVDKCEKDDALVSFIIIYKDRNSSKKHGVGIFSLKFMGNSWKITNTISWTETPYNHTK
ncbi:MAG: hypothetical protein U1F76_08250 [Candidatus Competibacteraceae bacterium]